jgi:ribosomal protein L20
VNYSRLIAQLAQSKIMLNRKSLAELAVHDLDTFAEVVKRSSQA